MRNDLELLFLVKEITMSRNAKRDTLGRLFTARCLIEMIKDDGDLNKEQKEQVAAARALLVAVHNDIAKDNA